MIVKKVKLKSTIVVSEITKKKRATLITNSLVMHQIESGDFRKDFLKLNVEF